MMNIHIENQLIIKYLRHRLSEEESALMTDWLKSDPSNQDFLFSLEELYWANQMQEMQQLADTNNEWKKLEEQIFSKQKNNDHKGTIVHRLSTILRYAAVVIIASGLSFIILQTDIFKTGKKQTPENYVTVVTKKGERSQLILPDGTKVWINANSSLSYNTDPASERQLKLSGEAYFEVTKDEHHPFVVSTSLLKIKVLGTKFNLRAFEEEEEVQATLYEGLVAASIPGKKFEKDIFLKPGEQLIYGNNTDLTVDLVTSKDDIKWKEGIYYFKKQKLRSIVRSLERSFNIQITIDDPKLSQEEFTCEFEKAENLVDILNILKMTQKLDYSITGSNVRIFSKCNTISN